MDNQELWQTTLSEIESDISQANFVTWFKNTYIISNKKGVVSIAVPNAFSKEWMENKYNKLILKALRNNQSDIKEVRCIIENKKSPPVANTKHPVNKNSEEDVQLKFEELQVNKKTNLNPKYTFESFVVGPSNEMANAAALSVADNPGSTYNPLFIYGGVGLGKTHLLQSIGNKVSLKNDNVLYLTSEQFTNDFISAVQSQGLNVFKNKYRKKDILIIDDIQFIAGKEQTQEEFFHTFNALHEQNKQIILSSDRPPKAIPTLEERLRSRFEGGMLVDIGQPDYETRVAILKTKVKNKNVVLSDDVINYIAKNIQKNIRELEGALNLVVASSKIYKNEITLEQTKKTLAHIVSRPRKPLTYRKIFKTIADYYEINEKELTGKTRKRNIVTPRQLAMYLMRKELSSSYPDVGEQFGGKDHTTVIHACEKIEREIQENNNFENEVNFIKQKLYTE